MGMNQLLNLNSTQTWRGLEPDSAVQDHLNLTAVWCPQLSHFTGRVCSPFFEAGEAKWIVIPPFSQTQLATAWRKGKTNSLDSLDWLSSGEEGTFGLTLLQGSVQGLP